MWTACHTGNSATFVSCFEVGCILCAIMLQNKITAFLRPLVTPFRSSKKLKQTTMFSRGKQFYKNQQNIFQKHIFLENNISVNSTNFGIQLGICYKIYYTLLDDIHKIIFEKLTPKNAIALQLHGNNYNCVRFLYEL